MRRTAALAWAAPVLLMAAAANAASDLQAPTPGAAPTSAEVIAYTQPLVRARLRIPDSLQAFAVSSIAPEPADPARHVVTVRFRARTPFGQITEHSARFRMKRSASGTVWIITADFSEPQRER